MKKIYLSILTSAFALISNAQSLTQAFNEPVVGNVSATTGYDSVGVVVPKSTGAGQIWDFTAFTANTSTASTSYISVGSSGPNSASYTGATLADFDGGSFYTYYKSTAGQFENLGFEDVNIILTFTNTAILANWPVSMGYNNTDIAAGTCTAIALGGMTGVVNGTATTVGSGTGTIMIPGGASFTNILQTTLTQTLDINIGSGTATLNYVITKYDYYHSSQKFPLLTVNYQTTTGSFPGVTADVVINNSVITGINDLNFEATFSIFPNPAKDHFNVKLSNVNNDLGKVEVINSLGTVAQTIDLGNDSEISKNVSISNLASGIYMIKTTLGNKVSTRKLIVE